LQFLPGVFFLTQKGLTDHQYDTLSLQTSHIDSTLEEPVKEEKNNAWTEVRELVSDKLHPLIDLLETKGVSLPLVGEEFEHNGGVIGELELAWHTEQTGVYESDAEQVKKQLTAQGWRLFTMEEAVLHPEDILEQLTI